MLVIVMLLVAGVTGCSIGNGGGYTGEAIDITDTDLGRQAIARAVARWNARPDKVKEYVEEDYVAYKLPRVSGVPGAVRIEISHKDSEIIWMHDADGKPLQMEHSFLRKQRPDFTRVHVAANPVKGGQGFQLIYEGLFLKIPGVDNGVHRCKDVKNLPGKRRCCIRDVSIRQNTDFHLLNLVSVLSRVE